MQKTFVQIVQQYFQFLIDEFGFNLIGATESPRGERWEGDVQYTTNTTYIDINASRGEAPSLWIGRTKDNKKHLLPLQVIYEYMTLNIDEKEIILSHPEGRQAAMILSNKQLSNLILQSGIEDERKISQLEAYVKCLRNYALPFLNDDFSQWLPIWEYQIGKLMAENSRAGRPEYIPTVITDDKGQLRVTGREHVFQKDLDYLKQLKDERNSAV